jgi:hypothetical protein
MEKAKLRKNGHIRDSHGNMGSEHPVPLIPREAAATWSQKLKRKYREWHPRPVPLSMLWAMWLATALFLILQSYRHFRVLALLHLLALAVLSQNLYWRGQNAAYREIEKDLTGQIGKCLDEVMRSMGFVRDPCEPQEKNKWRN